MRGGGRAPGKGNDLILAALVLAVTAMLLVPLPTVLLDFFITLNIAFSLLLLIVGLYLPDVLSLLSFPSLLLLTTLFRLSLNVASSRLILSSGDAGQVIEAFGTFLIRGQIAVGIIIFVIITIVNFIVIAKGAARVSEVAARFALEALPGKQSAIDADMHAGIITSDEARAKRLSLARESQLYGSMDGAMKFVQGDAIAGVFVILANIVGGMYVGLSQGMPLSDALQTFTRLTVGDGLVSQIPAILISVSAGIVVTRVSSSEYATLASDVGSQLFSRPVTLIIVGLVLCSISLLPGLPTLTFVIVGACFFATAFWLTIQTGHQSPDVERVEYGSSSLSLPSSGSHQDERQGDTQLVISLDTQFLFELYKQAASDYQTHWHSFQKDFFAELGLSLPRLSVIPNEFLGRGRYSVALDDVVIIRGAVPSRALFVEMNPQHAQALGLEVVDEQQHPMSAALACWISNTELSRELLEVSQIRYLDFFHFICFQIGVFMHHHPEELLTLSDVHHLLKGLDKRYPGLVAETVDREVIDVPRLTKILHQVIRDGLSIKDFKQVLEVVSTYCSTHRVTEGEDLDMAHLLAFLRIQRRRHLLSPLLTSRRTLKVISLSEEVQELFDEIPFDGLPDASLAIEPENLEILVNSYESLVSPIRKGGLVALSILCPADLRGPVDGLLRGISAPERVLSIDELEPSLRLEPVGVWNIK